MDTEPNVRDAVNELYAAFADERAPASPRPPALDRLAGRPLSSISAEQLADYLDEAVLVVGDEADYRYFLPRVFELFARGWDADRPEPEILLGRLSDAAWTQWPHRKESAVRRYLHAYWASVLRSHPSEVPVDSVLCGIALAERDVSAYLAAWLRAPEASGGLHLADYLAANVQAILLKRKLANLFWWPEHTAQRTSVIEWLRGPDVGRYIVRALGRGRGTSAEPVIAAALERWSLISSAPEQ